MLHWLRSLRGRPEKQALPVWAHEIAKAGEGLRDLNEFGVHLVHEPFVCVRCGGKIDPKWSSGFRVDALCEGCAPHGQARYAPGSNTVIVLGHDEEKRCYLALIKIDGILYYLESTSGGESDLFSFPEKRELKRKIGIGYWQLKHLADRGAVLSTSAKE